jgi:hypothetical protein
MGPRSPRSKCTAMLTSVASEIQLSRGSWITDPAKNTALEAALLKVVAVLPPLPLEPPEPEELAVDLDSMSDVLEQTTKQLRACVKLLTKSLPVLEKVEAPNGAVLQAARAVARHFELKDRWEQLSVLELGLNCEMSTAEEKKAAFAAVRPSDVEARTSAKQAYAAAKESAEKLEGAYKVSVAALHAAGLDTEACKSGRPFPLTLPEVEETVTGALAPEEEPPVNAISQAFNAAQAAAAAPAPAAAAAPAAEAAKAAQEAEAAAKAAAAAAALKRKRADEAEATFASALSAIKEMASEFQMDLVDIELDVEDGMAKVMAAMTALAKPVKTLLESHDGESHDDECLHTEDSLTKLACEVSVELLKKYMKHGGFSWARVASGWPS